MATHEVSVARSAQAIGGRSCSVIGTVGGVARRSGGAPACAIDAASTSGIGTVAAPLNRQTQPLSQHGQGAP